MGIIKMVGLGAITLMLSALLFAETTVDYTTLPLTELTALAKGGDMQA